MNRLKLILIKYKFEVTLSLLFFILYLPITLNITFYQNDDWYYYNQVELFLQGKFRLLNEIAPTFYIQGFLGSLFSLLFGLSKLPFLTLFVSAVNVFLFLLILRINNIKTLLKIISFIIFISFPVFSYSILGFMTENYFLLFVLLSILYFNKYIKNNDNKSLYLAVFFGFVSFFVKQNGIILISIFSIYELYQKNYRKFFVLVICFLVNLLFYTYLFPQTFEMKDSKFTLLNFSLSNIVFFTYTSLSYMLILVFILFAFFKINLSFRKPFIFRFSIFLIVFAFFFILFLVYSQFKLHPYFGNTFSHLGYMYGSIEGTKPVARFMSRLFILYTQMAPFLISIFVFYFYLNFKKLLKNKLLNFYVLAFVAFQTSNLLLSVYFDRYLIIPFVLFLLFVINLLNENKFKFKVGIFVIPFLVINFYISYLFSWDFVLTNKYVWERAKELVNNEKVLPELVYGNGAWIEKYNVKKMENCIYVFNYDTPLKNSIDNKFVLIEKREFNELKPFYKKSAIYLYRNSTL